MAVRLRERIHERRPSTLVVTYAEGLRLLRGPLVRAWAACALTLALAVPFLLDRFFVHLMNLSLIAVVGAVALNLLTGTIGLISLGQAAFLATGGFTAALMVHYWNAPIVATLPAAALAGGVLGALVGIPSLRLRAVYVAVTTLALHFAVVLGANELQFRTAAYAGLVMPRPALGPIRLAQPEDWYYLLLAFALAAIVIGANLRRTRIGRAWMAIHDHEVAAEALGVALARSKLQAMILTSAMVSVAGALAGYYAGVVSAETYTIELALAYLAMIIIGGLGRVLGAVLGAFFITWLGYVVEEGLRGVGIEVGPGKISGLRTALYSALVIGFLLFEPGGLAELWTRIRNYIALWPFRTLPLQQRER